MKTELPDVKHAVARWTKVSAALMALGGAGAGNGNFMIGQTYTITGTRVYNLTLPLILR